MTDKEILEKAIQKAIDGGWDVDPTEALNQLSQQWVFYGDYKGYSGMLFSHDFAKALWGDQQYIVKEPSAARPSWDEAYLGWEFHLQNMVVSSDPIKYLGENI